MTTVRDNRPRSTAARETGSISQVAPTDQLQVLVAFKAEIAALEALSDEQFDGVVPSARPPIVGCFTRVKS
jgi:hypothetical protein